ncbi:sulfatase-like hydrolase/transferase [Candidatus Binatia bacterium]|nr:sulfatase-like hydrolase/transferase [Candidatus Binatia bacterium]
MSRVVRVLALLSVAAGVLWAWAGARARQAQPNIVLVSIDSLRADHVGAYGYPRDTSPTIDGLARDGVLFEQAFSSAPWTIPAHMSLLTGLPPELHRVESRASKLSPDAVTLAEVLRDAGYTTAGIVSGPTVMGRYGFDQGFTSYDESMVEKRPARVANAVTSPGLVRLVDAFLTRWHDGGRAQPFFLFLHMWDVHYDYAPPDTYVRRFDPDYTGGLDARDLEHNTRLNARMDARDLQHLVALYDGEIRYTDDHLAQVVARLRTLGVLDDTILVVTADHGDEFFEHGQKGHAKTLYDEVLHVPLVVRYPRRIAAGQRVAEQVRATDVAPTILGLAGVAATPGFGAPGLAREHRSLDLTPYVAGAPPRPGLPALPAFSTTRWLGGRQNALRTAGAKLIRYQPPLPHRAGIEVFDLGADPGEQTNLHGSMRDQFLATLTPRLEDWASDASRQTTHALALAPAPEQDARLRALGYVE